MPKLILGFIGKIACGKGTASDYIVKKYNAESYRYSDPLKDALEIFDLEHSRQNLQTLSTILRKNFSEDILAKAMLKRTNESLSDIVIIDGIRRYTDFANFQLLENFHLIYMETNQQLRYQRYTARNQGPGDSTMSFKEFKEKDKAESERQIDGLKNKTHLAIQNNGSYEELYKQLHDIIEKIK